MFELNWAGHEIVLYPERALWLPALRALVVADTHFGKPAAFRASGVPVPRGTTAADLARLGALLERSGASRLIVLGDFFHAPDGCDEATLGALEAWLAARPKLAVTQVRGNHDRRCPDPPAHWGVNCLAAAREGSLVFRHEPRADAAGHVLAGHLHPAVALAGAGDALRAACFWFGSRVATLPAFGSFTGMKAIRPAAGDRVFALGPAAVVEVTPRASRATARRAAADRSPP